VLHEVALAVRARQVSVETLVRAALERIERHDFALNAVVALRAEEALAEARAVDEQVARDEPLGPLAGIPLLVKDIEDVAGMVTTHGSLLHADDPPASSDGLVPGRLRSAGAIVVGKTNVPEFAFEGYTANRVFGVTRNPWGHDWSPGGSSGGSAAAMMAGMAPIATASDGGGSIRIPSAACGLVGLKPTNGIVGRRPIPAWIDLSTDGPFATTVADLRLLLSLEAGPVAGDPSALPRWEPGPDRLPSRVLAAPRTVPWGPLPAAVESAVALAVERLGGAPEILVQAAGIYRVRALLETDAADWDEVLEVNLRGTFLVARAVVAAGMGRGSGGSIVNVASVAAFAGGAEEPSGAYDASKAGVCALTRQMAVEWGPRGIRANAVAPGLIATPMLRLMDDPVRGSAYLETRVPLRRLGRADEVAALICFLASDEASYLTGATVLVDGGLLAR